MAQYDVSATTIYKLIEKKIHHLRKLGNMLQRVSQNEAVGVCENCGASIPFERLYAVPETGLCVTCQREMEAGNRLSRYGGCAC